MVAHDYDRYAPSMGMIAATIAANLRQIRTRVAGTQERWEDLTGMNQVTVSRFERQLGLGVLDKLEQAVLAAGADPRDLLALSVQDHGAAELLDLWRLADPDVRDIVVALLRRTTAPATRTGKQPA